MILRGWQAADPQRDMQWGPVLVLALLFAIEALAFFHYAQREILWHQPEFYDQAVYLISSYQIEAGLRSGSLHDLVEGLSRQIDSALPLEGAGLAVIFGGDRLPRLFVNFAFFCLAQLVVFRTVQCLTGRSIYGIATVGLLLSQAFLFQPAGGMFDFRLDFTAACLFGVWLCSLLCAARHSLASGVAMTMLAAAALLLHRFVVSIQMLPVLVLLTVACAASAVTYRTAQSWLRLRHAGLSLLLTFVMIGCYAAWKWAAISNYYVEGHLVGDEKIARAHEMGLFMLFDHMMFYPRSIAQGQLGSNFMGLAAAGLVIAAAIASGSRRQTELIGLCASAAILPLAVLTVDVSKSMVVASVAALPMALGVCLICFSPGETRRTATVFTAMLFITGGGLTAAMRLAEPMFSNSRTELMAATALARDVGRQIAASGWQEPIYLSVDAMTSRVNVPAMTVLIREETGKLYNLQMALGARVDAFDQSSMEADLAQSHLLVTTPYAGAGPLPFDASMKAFRRAFEASLRQDFSPVGTYGEGAGKLTLYVRRTAPATAHQDVKG